MKICMVVPNPLVKGGIASVVNGYRGSALEQKHQVYYVESYRNGSKWQKLFKAVGSYFVFAGKLLVKRPDVVHIHSSFGASFYRKIPFIYLSRWAKIPIVNHIHGAEFDVFYTQASDKKKRLISKVYGKCNRLIVLSTEWKEIFSQIIPQDRIDVVENYCIVPEEPYNIGRRKEQILFLGELGERKGCLDIPDILVRILQKCPQAQLVMAGDGQMERVKKAFAEKEILERVTFPGWVRGETKQRLLQESAIFLFPTYHEGMPMAVLEAMSYGLGIVTTAVGGIPKLIRYKENGYLEKPGDVSKIAEDVICLLQEEATCRYLGQRARALVGQNYSLEAHLEKLEQTYNRVKKQ